MKKKHIDARIDNLLDITSDELLFLRNEIKELHSDIYKLHVENTLMRSRLSILESAGITFPYKPLVPSPYTGGNPEPMKIWYGLDTSGEGKCE